MSATFVVLLDESDGMKIAAQSNSVAAFGAESERSKGDMVATALNVWLAKVGKLPGIRIALVGYRSGNDGETQIRSRWTGGLAGKSFVRSDELISTVLRTDKRKRTVGSSTEEIDFPIWYQPDLGGQAPQVAAWTFCQQQLLDLVSAGVTDNFFILHITSGVSTDGNPLLAVRGVQELAGAIQQPIVFNVHLASQTKMDAIPATVFPANRAYLPSGSIRDLFDRTSQVPSSLFPTLRSASLPTNEGARGLVFNGRMLDMTRCFNLAYAFAEMHQENWQASPESDIGIEPDSSGSSQPSMESEPLSHVEEETVAGDAVVGEAYEQNGFDAISKDRPALILFILDRSAEDPYSRNDDSECRRLCGFMGQSLSNISKLDTTAVQVAVVSYGADSLGMDDTRDMLDGGLAGKHFASANELEAGAVRIEEFVEERVSNGKIFEVKHRHLHVVEIEPSMSAPPTSGFRRAAELIAGWQDEHQGSPAPIALHLTRAKSTPDDIQKAVDGFWGQFSANPPTLYSLVALESASPTAKYPSTVDELPDSSLETIWRNSSLLLGREELAETRPKITAESRGFVCNDQFDQLLYVVREALEANNVGS